ncbi:MAG: hypothetical protein V4556_01305 [Bacteroidota bacterium]
MKDFEKYFGLMTLLIAGLVGSLLLGVGIFYLLKLFAITLFNFPGFHTFFGFVVTIVPYLIFFAGYYYMHKKIQASPGKISRNIGKLLLIIGSLSCFIIMLLLLLHFWGIKNEWLYTIDRNSHWGLISQILILFFTAMIIATGDKKEKDWMER